MRASGVVYEASARLWAKLSNQREHGRGRKPNALAVRNAAKRLGLADMTLQAATARLETLARSRSVTPTRTPAALLDQMRDDDDEHA